LSVNKIVGSACQRYPNLEVSFVWSLIWEESKYDTLARGSKGEIGLGQLKPATADGLGVRDRTNVPESVEASIRHLSYPLRKYRNDTRLVLAAYNSGEPIVDRCHGMPAASRAYVSRIEQSRLFAKTRCFALTQCWRRQMYFQISKLRPKFPAMVFLLILTGLCPATAQDMKPLSTALAKSITASGRKTVAVVDFTDLQGNVNELGRFLAEDLSVDLVSDAKGFEVIDRTHLKSILQEHRLATTGLIDPQTARKLGEIAGVDALVTGTMTPFGDSVRLSAKVLDTATAKTIAASTAEVPKTKAIEELLSRQMNDINLGRQNAGNHTQQVNDANPDNAKSPAASQAALSVEENNFRFEVKSCEHSGSRLRCFGTVTNRDENRRVFGFNSGGIYRQYTDLIDATGNQYHANRSKLGTEEGREQELEPELPMNFLVEFQGISSTVSRVNLILSCVVRAHQGYGGQGFKVTLRNLAVLEK